MKIAKLLAGMGVAMLMCTASVQAQDAMKQAEQKAKDEAQKQTDKAKEKALEEAKKQAHDKLQQGEKAAGEQAGHQAGQPDMANMSMDQMMAMWEKANAKGEAHAWMNENMVGDWDATCEWAMAPGAPTTKESAKARGVSMFDGRFVRWDYSGSMMGKQYSGMGLFGYNNATKQFEQIWVDSTGTGFFNMTGEKQGDNTIVYTGSMKNPLTGQDQPYKASMKMTDKNTMLFEMFEKASDGTEFKSMTITYTRVTKQ